MCVLALPCNGRRYYGLFATLHSKITTTFANLFIKIIHKMHLTVKSFDNQLLIFKTGSSVYRQLLVFRFQHHYIYFPGLFKRRLTFLFTKSFSCLWGVNITVSLILQLCK